LKEGLGERKGRLHLTWGLTQWSHLRWIKKLEASIESSANLLGGENCYKEQGEIGGLSSKGHFKRVCFMTGKRRRLCSSPKRRGELAVGGSQNRKEKKRGAPSYVITLEERGIGVGKGISDNTIWGKRGCYVTLG